MAGEQLQGFIAIFIYFFNVQTFGATLEIVTDKSQEGAQFVRGFGGIGGKDFLQFTL